MTTPMLQAQVAGQGSPLRPSLQLLRLRCVGAAGEGLKETGSSSNSHLRCRQRFLSSPPSWSGWCWCFRGGAGVGWDRVGGGAAASLACDGSVATM